MCAKGFLERKRQMFIRELTFTAPKALLVEFQTTRSLLRTVERSGECFDTRTSS